jgi:ubiquinone/menaquinone biosynthesis C-methylase UbiE
MQKLNYWAEFWKDYAKGAIEKDEQIQVLRTLNKEPISKELWEFTLNYIKKQIEPNYNDMMLELCCGNGLISKYFSPIVKNITSVDISKDLINSIDYLKYPNINLVVSDIRKLHYDQSSFDKVIIYAGIQYLTLAETTELFEQVYRWLKPGGIFFLGDIPDYNKLWFFYNNPERQAVYFKNLKDGKDVVGTWFEPYFFEKLSSFVGFSDSMLIPQHPDLIYAKFRYDYKLIK